MIYRVGAPTRVQGRPRARRGASAVGDRIVASPTRVGRMAHRTVAARWPFHATGALGRSQDLEPVDPLWKDLQAGLGLAVATLPARARDHLPHRVDAGAADAGACMILLTTDKVCNGILCCFAAAQGCHSSEQVPIQPKLLVVVVQRFPRRPSRRH